MRGTLSSFIGWLRGKTGLHPSAADLLASVDGELESVEDARIKKHLLRCAICRQEVEQLQAGLRLFQDALAPLSTAFPLEEGLGKLHAAIRSWNEEHSESRRANGTEPTLSPAVCELLASELSIYLGSHSARTLLATCNRPGVQLEDLTAAIEPVITGFLGQQTGMAVVAKIVRMGRLAARAAAQSRPTA